MSSIDDKLVEILGDAAPRWRDSSGLGLRQIARRMLPERQYAVQQQQSFDPPPRRRHHHHHHHHRNGQQPGTPGAPDAPAAPAPAGQPFTGAVPIPPGNWGGGTYPPPGWSPGQPLPGYPQGWPPPGSPWPGNFTPGVSNVPQPTGVLTSYDPYGNPVFTPTGQPVQQQYDQYGNPIYPGMPAPTIDVTVGEALDGGMKMTEIIGCLKGAGYTGREISEIVGRCCGW